MIRDSINNNLNIKFSNQTVITLGRWLGGRAAVGGSVGEEDDGPPLQPPGLPALQGALRLGLRRRGTCGIVTRCVCMPGGREAAAAGRT